MLKDSRRPMPPSLRQRLRDIPRREVLCRDVDRLYRAARSRARDGEAGDRAAERHLGECASCRELYATLAAAFVDRRRSLPRRLAQSLCRIARPVQQLPFWIADTRYAAAACYLLAALALALAGDASALFRDTTTAVSSKARVWVDEGEARSLEVWRSSAAALGTEISEGWDRAVRYGTSSERFLTGVLETLETRTRALIPGSEPVEGDDDGRFGNDPE